MKRQSHGILKGRITAPSRTKCNQGGLVQAARAARAGLSKGSRGRLVFSQAARAARESPGYLLLPLALSLLYITTLLITMANDTEINPGPKQAKYPCQICQKEVTWKQKGVACDDCGMWHHAKCMKMPNQIYEALAQSNISWHCVNCGMPHFSTSLFDSTEYNDTDTSDLIGSPGDPQHTSSPRRPNKSTQQKHNLKTLVINFQSMKNKKEEIANLIDSADPDIIIGTETWLNPNITNREVLPNSYNVYRKDRADSYGGVLVAVKGDLISEEISITHNTEAIYIKVQTTSSKPLIIGSLYRPPSSDTTYMEEMCNTISTLFSTNKSAIIWLGGDLNLPDINWKSVSIEGSRYNTSINETFLETIKECGLEQKIMFPTRMNNTLDLYLTNRPSLVNRCESLPGLSDHDIAFIDSNVSAKRHKPIKRKIYIWKRAKIEELQTGAENINIEFHQKFEKHSCIEEMWSYLSTSLTELLDSAVPSKMSSTRYHQPWITGDVRRLSKRKKRAYSKATSSKDPADFHRYQELKKKTRKACKEAYAAYMRDIISPDMSTNPKRFWSFIKERRCENVGIAPLKGEDGFTHSDSEARANILNKQFSSVFTHNEDLTNIKDLGPSPYPPMPSINITTPGVMKLLKNIKIHKAAGPDNISNRLLKTVATQISPAFTTFFQASLNQGYLPKSWKDANVVPIFKKGDKSRASNYRPVSLTSVSCKILEHILCSAIMKHLERHRILSDAQHGFRRHRSCESQLIVTVNDLITSLDNKKQVDLILLDFSKAFDKVPHQRLLRKIEHYGIRGSTHRWLKDFLKDRSQRVLVEGATSSRAEVQSGVPQGSVLGPLMFLLFINDLPEYVKNSKVRLFADDCVLYKEIENGEDSKALQEDLNALQQWETDWNMEFHPQKCQLLKISNKRSIIPAKYTIHGHTLEEVDSAKYLGVTLHRTLNWNEHIQNITNKANRTRAFLQRNMQAAPQRTKEICYQALVRPILEYSSSVWDPWTSTNIDKIEAVQRRSARMVMNNFNRYASVDQMIQQLKWTTLRERRAKAKAIIFFRIVKNFIAIPKSLLQGPSPNKGRGHDQRIIVPYSRTQNHQYSFIPDATRIWNKLPQSLVDSKNLEAFKKGTEKETMRK